MGFEIDWSTAPKWAKYVARDENGHWHWYDTKPIKGYAGYWSYGRCSIALVARADMICLDRDGKEVKYD